VSESNASAGGSGLAGLPRYVVILVAVGLVLVFIALLFPWDSVARRVAWEIAAASGSRVTIDDLAPAITARGPVLRARSVTIEHPAVDRVRLAELELAPRLSSSWLSGEPKLRVWADSELGVVDGVLQLGPAPGFTGHVERVDLARLPLRLDASGLQLSGELAADADVVLTPDGTLSGRVDFESTSLVVQASALPIAIPFTRAQGVIEILESGATRIESAQLEGPVLEGDFSGEIGLVHRSQSPPVDLQARLRVVDPTLRGLAPSLGLQLSSEGEAEVRVGGTLDAPDITTLGGAARRRPRAARRPARPAPERP